MIDTFLFTFWVLWGGGIDLFPPAPFNYEPPRPGCQGLTTGSWTALRELVERTETEGVDDIVGGIGVLDHDNDVVIGVIELTHRLTIHQE